MSSLPRSGDTSFHNVLFLTDFSSASELALPYAVALARQYKGKIYIAHVIAPQMYEFIPPDFVPEVLPKITAYAERRMNRLVTEFDFGDVPHEALLQQGEIWDTLRQLADQRQIDVIALGTRGRRGLQKILMGSVAEEVIRLAHRPVLTVGPESWEMPPRNWPQTILLANDFSLNCAHAVACADSLAQKFGARLLSVHIAGDCPEDPTAVTRLEEFFTEKLEQCLPDARSSQHEHKFLVDFGFAAQRILKMAGEHKVDLIVMGARGAGSMVRGTSHLGTTAYRVVSEAHCPVLTARGESGKERQADAEPAKHV